jgi:putative sigma-54 modulation protein
MATIIVTGRDGHVTAKNREHAEDKITKLEKYFDGIGKIEAILGHSGDAAAVELVISVRKGNPIVCHSQAKDLYAAIDLVLDKAEAQLTKFKERRKAHKSVKDGGEKSGTKETSTPAEDDGLESYDEVIEKRDF